MNKDELVRLRKQIQRMSNALHTLMKITVADPPGATDEYKKRRDKSVEQMIDLVKIVTREMDLLTPMVINLEELLE